MSRVWVFLAVVAAVVVGLASPATAQTTESSVPCIPTSDTPFAYGNPGDSFPMGTVLILYGDIGGIAHIFATGTIAADGTVSFGAGLAPATYQLGTIDKFGHLVPQGQLQIGNCAPPPPPVPESRNECKKAGWQTFGTFKNQGQCVAFVSRGTGPS